MTIAFAVAPAPTLEDLAEQVLARAAPQEHVLLWRVVIAVAGRNRDAFDAELHRVSKNSATSCGFSPLNSVQLMVTRKPLPRASLIAATALSNTPSWHTDSSCRCWLPSR